MGNMIGCALFTQLIYYWPMAFVASTQRNFQPTTFTPSSVGPGSYQPSASKPLSDSCAPFLSTTSRHNNHSRPSPQAPGPGDYEIRTNIADPIIQAMTNSRSIIVKINSTGTGPFKSLQDRFEVKEEEVPGPGSYDVLESRKRKRSLDQHHHPRGKAQSGQKKAPSIPHKGASLYIEEIKEDSEGQVGPGAYELAQPMIDAHKGGVWGKDAINRFKSNENTTSNNLGPGKYYLKKEVEPDYKANPSSSFVSETVRTYFDKLLFKTNQHFKARLRMQANYKSSQPGPGFYDIKPAERNHSTHVFGISDRFSEDTQMTPGPGIYKIKSPFEKPQPRISKNISFDSRTEREPQFLSFKSDAPGPGSYECAPSNRFKYSYGSTSFVDPTERFVDRIPQEQDNIPGPGTYIRESKTMDLKPTNIFKSKTRRQWHKEEAPAPEVGSYNIDHTDISTIVKKQRVFIDNLKKIEVQKAPFDTSSMRFKHYEGGMAVVETEEQHKRFLPRRKVRTTAPSPRPRTEHPAFFAAERRFEKQKRKGPSVGAYNLQGQWEGKSYNVKFQKKTEASK